MNREALTLTLGFLCLAVLFSCTNDAPSPEPQKEKGQPLAPDGVPYATEDAGRVMQIEPLTNNLLLRNGSFEAGRYWPSGWQATDGLTTFWTAGGTDGKRCLRIYTDVLDAQWKQRQEQVRAAVARATRNSAIGAQSLPQNPVPEPPERIPTSPPYYDTVAGLHGVHYRSAYLTVKPGAVYRFSIDARTDKETKGEPKVFIKGFFDQRMATRDGMRTIRRDAYRAPMTLAPCGSQWRRYTRVFHPARSKSTLDGEPLEAKFLQVQIYAYWGPGNYYFDNLRLDIVGFEEPVPKPGKDLEQDTKRETPPLGEDEYPTFNP